MHDKNEKAAEKWSFLWLGLGFILSLMCVGTWAVVPLAAWLMPVFVLRFVRNQKIWIGSVLTLLMIMIATFISSRSVLKGSGAESAGMANLYVGILAVLYGMRFGIPYIADRILAHRVGGFLATLIFPLACVIVEFFYIQVSPYLSIGSMAYIEFGNLPLVQLVSITGIYGVIFLLSWFGPIVNWAWERDFAWPQIKMGLGVYACILALVLVFGGLRNSVNVPESNTVQLAGIVATPEIMKMQPHIDEKDAWTPPWREKSLKVLNYFFDLSQQQARAGAKIVAWQEYAAYVFPEDETMVIDRGKELARKEGIYLMMGLYTGPSEATKGLGQNKLVWITPNGGTKQYRKTHPTGMEEIVLGDGKMAMLDTPYGKIASAICFDMDDPAMIKQAGKADVDIMIVPAFDWEGFTPMHTNIVSFRGLENGASVIRIGGRTLTGAFDYQGRILSSANYHTSHGAIMVAHIPTHGVKTIYSVIGDLFLWLCFIGFVIMIGLAGRDKFMAGSAVSATSG